AVSGYQGGGGSMKPAAMTPLNLSAIPFEPTTLAAPEFMSGDPAPEEQAEKQVPSDSSLAAPVLMSGYPVAEEAGKQVPFDSSLAAPVLMSGYPVAEEAGKQVPFDSSLAAPVLMSGYPVAEEAGKQVPFDSSLAAPVLMSGYPVAEEAGKQVPFDSSLAAPVLMSGYPVAEEAGKQVPFDTPLAPVLMRGYPEAEQAETQGSAAPIPCETALAPVLLSDYPAEAPAAEQAEENQGLSARVRPPAALTDTRELEESQLRPTSPALCSVMPDFSSSPIGPSRYPVGVRSLGFEVPGELIPAGNLLASADGPRLSSPTPSRSGRKKSQGFGQSSPSSLSDFVLRPGSNSPSRPVSREQTTSRPVSREQTTSRPVSRGQTNLQIPGTTLEDPAANQAAPGPPPAVASRGEVEGVEEEANAAKQAAPGQPPPPASRGEVEGEQQEEASAAKQAAPGPPPPPGSRGEVEGVEEENRAANQAAPGPPPPPISRGDVDCEQQEEESSAAKEAAPGPPPPPVSRGDVDFERQEEEAIAAKQAAPGPPPPLSVSQRDVEGEEDESSAAKQLRAITISEADLVKAGDGGLAATPDTYELQVTIVKARGLRDADWAPGAGTSDPYCICEVKDKFFVLHTETIDDQLSPEWNFQGTIPEFAADDVLVFRVKDEDLGKEGDGLGEVHLSSAQITPHGFEGELKLTVAGHSSAEAYITVKIGATKLHVWALAVPTATAEDAESGISDPAQELTAATAQSMASGHVRTAEDVAEEVAFVRQIRKLQDQPIQWQREQIAESYKQKAKKGNFAGVLAVAQRHASLKTEERPGGVEVAQVQSPARVQEPEDHFPQPVEPVEAPWSQELAMLDSRPVSRQSQPPASSHSSGSSTPVAFLPIIQNEQKGMRRSQTLPTGRMLAGEQSAAEEELQGRLRMEMEAHELCRGQAKDLERKLKIANSKLSSPPRVRKPARFGITDPGPYAVAPSTIPSQPSLRKENRLSLPALKPLRSVSPRRDPGDAVLPVVQNLLDETVMMSRSRAEQSRSRVEAFNKLGGVGMSTWDVRCAEKKSRYQDMNSFTDSMYASFHDWRNTYNSPG
ncbi:unnamed protein product, partial [Polarella glacialis]